MKRRPVGGGGENKWRGTVERERNKRKQHKCDKVQEIPIR
jgi:hypothetical protein